MFRRVAIVHDWLITMRGGERVLESLCRLYPSAHIFTLRHDPGLISPLLARHPITTSFVDRLARTPLLRGRFRGLLPLFPLAAESFRLDGHDLVISSSHCVAAGVLAPAGALHVAYVHSPMRYVWEAQPSYEADVRGGAVGKWVFRAAAHYLRLWDAAASARPDLMIANSDYTRRRIQRYYGRDAEVIEPPIDTERLAELPGGAAEPHRPDPGAPLLVVSALVPYKRVELAVRAMEGRDERMVVVGEGPERAALERIATPNVSFRGWVDEQTLLGLYRGCRALVHPAIDDFGMVVVEALAAGKPAVVSREGGAAEIISPGETGIFIDSPTIAGVRAALDRLAQAQNQDQFVPSRLRHAASRFDRVAFERRFAEAVNRAAHGHRGAVPQGPVNPRSKIRIA